MYKVLLSDYEQRQKQLLLENAELKKILQQMKKDIISLLPPQKQKPKERSEDGLVSILQLKLNLHSSLVSCWSNLIVIKKKETSSESCTGLHIMFFV